MLLSFLLIFVKFIGFCIRLTYYGRQFPQRVNVELPVSSRIPVLLQLWNYRRGGLDSIISKERNRV